MKVALVHASDFGGGAERSVVSLHLALRERGHESTLWVGYRQTDTPGVREIERPRVLPGLVRGARLLEDTLGWQNLYAPGFRRLVDRIDQDTDVVNVHSIWGAGGYGDPGALPALSRRFPLVLTMRESWLITGHCACPFTCERWTTGCGSCPDLERTPSIPRDGTRFNWLRKRSLLRRTEAVVTTVSDWLRDEALRSPLLAGKEVVRIHNGIDLDTFRPETAGSDGPDPKLEARRALGLPADRFVVLIAGQTIEGHREGIAEAGPEALDRIDDPRLLVMPVGRSAELVAGRLGADAHPLPFQETPAEMARCYRAADLTLVSSEYESFGRIAAESQACGTPVVTVSTGGLSEVVEDGTGGIVVPPRDAEALAAGVRRLMEDPAERARMARDGVEYARRMFDEEKIADEYVRVYRRAIRARGVGAPTGGPESVSGTGIAADETAEVSA